MNQTCKVCGEPAAGFHFGAFTCEGCKSFFGRSYNNAHVINDCKNNSECVINKKNRTACKACRLRKCLMVGMSKSGSRYGRRSNWFKIHCLLQETQQMQHSQPGLPNQQNIRSAHKPSPLHHPPMGMGLLGANPFPPQLLHLPKTKEELILLGLDEYKNNASPSVSSPESHNSDSSVELNEARRLPLFHGMLPHPFLPPPSLLFPGAYPSLYSGLLQPANNNNGMVANHNPDVEAFSKRIMLDAVLQSQRIPTPEEVKAPAPAPAPMSPIQEDPMDLSMKTASERGSSPANSDGSGSSTERGNDGSEASAEDSDGDSDMELKRIKLPRPTPLDLTTKV